jgi:5-formyltetrahydrofolate cyclo-ligase
MTDLRSLRRQLKQRRASLGRLERRLATRRILARLRHHPRFLKAHRLAAYVGNRFEVDPMPLLAIAHGLGKRCYLPVLHPFRAGRLLFCEWRPGARMTPNRYGIPEPLVAQQRLRTARQLDLLIMPLLGFDAQADRLGMGGGYYDRTLAFTQRHPGIRRPYLLGVAFEVQRVERIQRRTWDIAIDAVVTERRIYRGKRKQA